VGLLLPWTYTALLWLGQGGVGGRVCVGVHVLHPLVGLFVLALVGCRWGVPRWHSGHRRRPGGARVGDGETMSATLKILWTTRKAKNTHELLKSQAGIVCDK